MSAEVFVDTNVFVYALDRGDSRKHAVAHHLVRSLLATRGGCTSYQVAQEFLNVATKGVRIPLDAAGARQYLDAAILPLVTVWPSPTLFHRALDVKARWGFGFYDCLIVAAAHEAGAARLLTEDLQPGQRLDGLVVENPFA